MMADASGRDALISRRRVAAGLLAILVIGALAGGLQANRSFDLEPGPNEYNLGAWEIRHLPQKWLFLAGEFLRGEPPVESQDAHLRRFLELTREIDAAQASLSDESRRDRDTSSLELRLRALNAERDAIENQVEATLEARISEAAADLGLTRSFLDVVWPPVDLEFAEAPRALVTSPRDRIQLLGSELLRAGLSISELEAIEAETQASRDVSALAFRIGGVGAYPSIVDYPTTYSGVLQLAAHEWTHHYLFFRPLGIRYYSNNDLRTINETVAGLVGSEIADAVLRRWPLSGSVEQPARSEVADSEIDLGEELRALRADAEALLAAGEIDAAEALMEQKRRELVDAGFSFRKLNQAYFAFTNLYAGEAGSPAAVNPIGPKVDQLRDQSDSLKQFVDRVSAVTSVEDLDRLLSETAP
jgi:hypothetical protein